MSGRRVARPMCTGSTPVVLVVLFPVAAGLTSVMVEEQDSQSISSDSRSPLWRGGLSHPMPSESLASAASVNGGAPSPMK